jgi:hypothetical protein
LTKQIIALIVTKVRIFRASRMLKIIGIEPICQSWLSWLGQMSSHKLNEDKYRNVSTRAWKLEWKAVGLSCCENLGLKQETRR